MSCTQQTTSDEESNDIILVDIAEFSDIVSRVDSIQIVDVRTAKEHELSSIPGAVNIDYWGDNFVNQIEALDKERPVVVYCAAGVRSAKAADKFKELGFKQIYDLEGGMRAWHTRPVSGN